jgi:hypothetical protein
VTADLIDLARAGDGEAFRQLVGPDSESICALQLAIPEKPRPVQVGGSVRGYHELLTSLAA